jgi:hypothetical protein
MSICCQWRASEREARTKHKVLGGTKNRIGGREGVGRKWEICKGERYLASIQNTSTGHHPPPESSIQKNMQRNTRDRDNTKSIKHRRDNPHDKYPAIQSGCPPRNRNKEMAQHKRGVDDRQYRGCSVVDEGFGRVDDQRNSRRCIILARKHRSPSAVYCAVSVLGIGTDDTGLGGIGDGMGGLGVRYLGRYSR